MKLLFYVLGIFLFESSLCDDVIVETITPKGKIRGHILKSSTGREYYAFQEIPYASSISSKSRLWIPKKANDWGNILDATKNTKICMQATNPYNMTMSEDCLYLNIYTPRKPNRGNNLPVALFIHPGNFMEGSGAFQYYNPEYWMDHDIVIVTMNYRLGAFGFLFMGTDDVAGNVGLRDQRIALSWCTDNIQVFGGNPDNIALIGHGSGAASIGYHYQLGRDIPIDCGILQSGSSLGPQWYQPDPVTYAKKLILKINPKFNFSAANSAKAIPGILHKPTSQQFLQFSEEIVKEEAGKGIFENLVWLPTVESYMLKNPYVVAPMLDSWISGVVRSVRTMYGFTSGEMSQWASKNNLMELAKKYDANPALLINSRMTIPAQSRMAAGQALKKLYTSKTFQQDQASLIRYLSDIMTLPLMKMADVTRVYMYNYVYQFSYKGSSKEAGVNNFFNNIPHGAELKYFWKMGNLSPAEKKMSDDLLTMWVNFISASTIEPTPDGSKVLGGKKWLPFLEFDDEITLVEFGDTARNATVPSYKAINDLLDKYIEEPKLVY